MFILASKSQRRSDILSRYIDFKVISYDIEENNIDYDSPEQLVMALSFEKGIEVAKNNLEDIVLSADTLVVIDNKVLGKPRSRDEAKIMIKKLSGREHRVLTAYSIFKLDKKIKYTDYVESSVKFKNLSEEDIENYLDRGEYIDKAGAYGIQGLGAILVEKINGDFENIVGLPISKIADDLKKLFNISLMKGAKYGENRNLSR